MDLQHMRPFVEPRLIGGATLSAGKPRSPREGRTALPEELSNVTSRVRAAPPSKVTSAVLATNPSAETATG